MGLSIVSVGACYLDTILTVSHYPAEDEKLRASRLEKRRGGNVPNTIEVLQQILSLSNGLDHQEFDDSRANLDSKLILLAVLPSKTSAASQKILSSLEGPLVDCSLCLHREEFQEAASSYIIRNSETGSRTIVNYNELPEMTEEELVEIVDTINERSDDDQIIYHFEGRIPNVIGYCIQHLRKKCPEAIISVEVEKPNRDGLQELAVEADVIFYSKSWAKAQGYKTAEECLTSQGALTKKASYLCCTWGEDGAAALKLPEKQLFTTPVMKMDGGQVIDTIGAGDTFIAGILYGISHKAKAWSLMQTLEFASKLASHKVRQEGFSKLVENMKPKKLI